MSEPGEQLERRAVVALFVDISGFTEMVESGDVEEVRETMGGAFARVARIVGASGGTVEKYIGDAVLALFGARRAHRDDVDRAVGAALAIRDALAEQRPPLRIRAGIELGDVLVDMVRLESARDLMVLGDAVNLAARLQQSAEPGEVALGPEAAALTTAPLGGARVVRVKGKAQPVALRTVLGSPRGGVRDDLPLVGREAELAALDAALAGAAAAGAPVVVVLCGEPGIGKSRVCAEWARAGAARVLLASCRPPGEGSAATVLRGLLAADLGEAGGGGAALSTLRSAHAARSPDDTDPGRVVEVLGITAGLVAAPVDDASLVWTGRADEAQVAWGRYLTALARAGGRPLALVLDDAHWASPDLVALLDAALGRIEAPVLVVLSAWEAASVAGLAAALERRVIEVGPLPEAQAARLAEAAHLEGERLSEAVTRAGGNPLYLELVGRAGPSAGLPLGVREAVTARLDSLDDALRGVVAAAAVVGGGAGAAAAAGAEVALLAAIIGAEEPATAVACARLAAAGILVEAGRGWAFRHALLAAAADAALTRRDRRRLHGLAAAHLRRSAGAPPADLARHLDGAGEGAAAVEAYEAAAQAAMQRYETGEADRLLARAGGIADLLGGAAVRARVWRQRGHALFAAGRAADAREAFDRSVDLLADSDPVERARALAGRAVMSFWDLDVDGAERDARAAIDLAGGAAAPRAEGTAALAFVYSSQGLPAAAMRLAREARSLAGESGLGGLAAMAGMVGVLVHHHAGNALAAVEMAQEVADDCRREGQVVSLVWTLYKSGLASAALGRFGEAMQRWDEMCEVARRSANAAFISEADNCRGHVLRELGEPDAADEWDHASLAASVPAQNHEASANATLNLAASAMGRGDLDAVRERLDEAQPYLAARAFYRWRYTQRWRYYRSRLLLAEGRLDEARVLATESLELGRRAGSGKNTLRPLLLLATLRAAEGDPRGAAADLVAVAAEAERMSLRPIAWRAHGGAAEMFAGVGDTTAAQRARAGAVRVLADLDGDVPERWRTSFQLKVAATIEAGETGAWLLPL